MELTITNELAEVSRVADLVTPVLHRWQIDEATGHRVQLVLEEILSNVIRHAFPDDGDHEISVGLAFDGECVEIHVRDDGSEFDPSSAPPVDTTAPLKARRVGGLGLHLVRGAARQMRYRREQGHNDLRIRV